MANKAIRKLCLISFLAIAVFLSISAGPLFAQASPEGKPAPTTPMRWESVTNLIQEYVNRRDIAGGVILIMHRGKPVCLKAAGMADMEAKTPMSQNTIFRIASMTKPITSVAVMMLVEDGKLRLEDPVSKYLPEFKDMTVLVPTKGEGKQPYHLVKADREITIRHLLSHTSGITNRMSNRPHLGKLYADAKILDGLVESRQTVAENIGRLAKLPLLHQPGTQWEYGLGIDVLGRVVEVVSGKSLDAFFCSRIFEPLRMHDTSFIVPKDKRSRLAALYTPNDKKKIQRVGENPMTIGSTMFSATYSTADDNRYQSGGAGLASTANDYCRFLQMMLNRGELDGKRILKAETVDEMTRNQIGDLRCAFPIHGDGFGYGFGVVTGREKPASPASTGSYSWGGIFDTFFWVDPKDELIGIVLTQLYPFGHLNLWKDLQENVYETLKEKTGSASPRVDNQALRQAALINPGRPERGKTLFASETLKCAVCHKVAGKGGEVGPDLSQIGGKFDRPHLIESILDPSAEILQGYQSSIVATKAGRTFTGIIKSESKKNLTLMDAEGKLITVPVEEIESREVSKVSLMPAGLVDRMTPADFTDLIAYLQTLRTGRTPTPGEGVTGTLTLPEGFMVEMVASRLTGATALETTSDGRILVGEQTGALRVIKDGKLLPEPFVKLQVDSTWERGLIGVTVAPDFPKTPHVFVCYVAAKPYPHHVISRFTAAGNVAKAKSEKILLEGDDQTKLGGDVPAGHQGGALHFGKDGKLYITIGDQTAGKPAQELNSLLGRLLRINPDGTIPDDNPFAAKATGKYRATWALGMRNPYTFAVQPHTGRLFINDVGGKSEEVNEGFAGANYGWPTVDHGPTADPAFRGPIHYYPEACIAGGVFAPTDLPWPKEYRGMYFFGDFKHGWIKTIDPANPAMARSFAVGLRRPVDMRFAPDGSLYVLLRDAWVIDNHFKKDTGALLRVHYTGR
jgi:putative heme-binding domain-containing protein